MKGTEAMEDSTQIDQETYAEASKTHAPYDEKGRRTVTFMDDREIMEELLMWMRGFADALESAGENPMLRAMIPSLRK